MGKWGRKRKQGVIRHPSGQIKAKSDYELEKEALGVVIGARQRVFGLSEGEAKMMEAGSAVGRLFLAKEISRRQLDAAARYEEAMRLSRWAMLVKPVLSGSDLNRSGSHDNSDGTDPRYVAQCKAAVEQARNCRRALTEAGSFCMSAVDGIVMDGQDMPSFVGDLRVGLNAIARLFKIPADDQAREAA